MKHFIITVRREDGYETIYYSSASIVNFILKLGSVPVILFCQEISEAEADAYRNKQHIDIF